MDNAAIILKTLDEHLDHPVRLARDGRAALHLGFANPPAEAGKSQDVDCIIPMTDLESLTADAGFWDAQEATNEKLRPAGLYITHLFREYQVFMRRGWEQHILPITRPPLRWLKLFRPAALDLILTKMMRGADPQDMADAEFMIRHERVTEPQLLEAFSHMKPIEWVELRDAFERAKHVVLKMSRTASI